MKQFLNKLTSMILVLSMFVTLSMPAVGEGSGETVPEQSPAVAQTEETQVPETVIEEPIAEEPVAEEPIIEEPVVSEPTVEEPVTNDDPVIENPVIEEPVVTDPIIDEPIIEEPVVVEPTGEEPTTGEPVVEEPVIEEPATEEPATAEPTEEPAEPAEETEDEEANQPEEEAEEEEILAEDGEPLVMRNILVGADEMAFRDQWQNPTEPLNWSNGVWYWLYGRGVEPAYNPNAVLVEISGMLPETVTAVARYIEFADAEIHSELAMMMLDVALYDADGMLYQPTEPLYVSVGSGKLYDAIANGKSFVGYFNDVDDRGLLFDSFAAMITVRTDESADGSRLVYTPGQDGDSVCFRESGDALVPTESGTLDFEESGFPFRVLFSAQQADRTLYAESWNSSASVVVEGPMSENFYVEAASPDLALYDVEGSSLMSLDVSLALDNVGVCQPEAPVTVTISDSSIAEAISNGGELQLWSVESDGMAYEVPDATFYGDSVAFETGNVSQYIIQNITLSRDLVASDGSTYEITVTYPPNSGIPSNAELYVEELLPWTDAYYAYLTQSAAELGVDPESLTFARAFDITLVDPATGMHYQPNQNVQVSINLINTPLDNQGEISVLHFNDVSGGVEAMDYALNGEAIEFETGGFSVFMVMGIQLEKTITASDGNTYRISVTYDAAAGLPRDAELAVSELSGEEYNQYAALTAEALDADELNYARIFDISIVGSDGLYYQPNSDVTVVVELVGENPEFQNLQVVHFGNVPETVDADVQGSVITFRTDSFSIYSITDPVTYRYTYRFFVPTDATQTTYKEYTIWTDLGGTTFTQIIKEGEGLVVPELPSITDPDKSTFAGWFEEKVYSGGTTTHTELKDTPFDFEEDIPETFTESKEIHLFAVFSHYAYVIFHEQYHGNTWPVMQTRRGVLINGTTSIDIDDVSVAYDDSSDGGEDDDAAPAMAFRGWAKWKAEYDGRTSIPETAELESSPISISGNVDLYPVFVHINWLTFISGPSGSGATYFAPTFFYIDEGVSDFSDYLPTRKGYSFAGWYADAACTVQLSNSTGILTTGTDLSGVSGLSWDNGKLKLSENVTIYAKWDLGQTDYTVIIWRQKVTDNKSANDAEKKYDFAESFPCTARSGSTVNITNTTRNYTNFGGSGDYTGFHYNANNSDISKTVDGNGTTVLNVRYDRDLMTFNFRGYVSNNAQNYSTSYSYVGNVSGNYYPLTRNGNSWIYHDGNGNAVTYNGNIYRIVDSTYSSNYTRRNVLVWTGLYGQTFSQAGYSWNMVSAFMWRDNVENIIQTFLDTFNTANDNTGRVYTLDYYGVSGSSRIYHYRQQLDGTYSIDDREIAYGSGGNFNFTNKFFGYTVSSYSTGENGFSRNGGRPLQSGVNSYPLHVYHERNRNTLSFVDAYTNEVISTAEVLYGASLKDFLPESNPISTRVGYEFAGWYYEKTGASDAAVKFDEDSMPATNLIIYACWATQWYLVQVDPNGGEYPAGSSYSTWFWKQYGTTELVTEYENTTRHFQESLNGTWYYAVQDRKYYGLSDEWEDREDSITDRRAYYTQDISDPAIVDLGTKYEEHTDAYRYANWYEVEFDDAGNEIGEHLYNFSTQIDHDMTLRLHWKQVGTYYIRYEAGEGTLDGNDNNEETFKVLDDIDYADHSYMVVTRTANAPEGYNFVGWTIRGADGTVYFPGSSFEFQSKYAFTEVHDGVEKQYLILDAVYSRVSTATIIYNANGGTISASADAGYPINDNGEPVDQPVPQVIRDTDNGVVTVKNLVNNSGIKLSSGSGFTLENAENAVLTGWNTEPDGSGTHYSLGVPGRTGEEYGDYYVDTEEPVTLYAEWKVRVYYHLNHTDTNWGGEWNDVDSDGNPIFTPVYESGELIYYYQELLIHNAVTPPTVIPQYVGDEGLTFHYWATERYSDNTPPAYDFSSPVTGELHLYGYWEKLIQVPVHVVDSTEEEIVSRDTSWRRKEVLEIQTGTDVPVDGETNAGIYTQVPAGYAYAFTTIHNRTASLNSISEENAVSRVYYNPIARKVYVSYLDGRADTPLADEDEVFFVYYQEPMTVNVGYKLMNESGSLTDAAMNRTGYPLTASVSTAGYDMAGSVTQPLYWANQSTYLYYAFAIGDKNAASDANLHLVTESRSSDSARPDLQVRNTWRGFQYSMDGGNTWINCGYSLQLYVVYFTSRPTIITLNEKTFGFPADMSEKFEYEVKVDETVTTIVRNQEHTRDSYYSWGRYYWYDDWTDYEDIGAPISTSSTTETVSINTYHLSNGESETTTIFYTPEQIVVNSTSTPTPTEPSWQSWTQYQTRRVTITTITQTVTITQKSTSAQQTKYVTSNDGTDGDRVYVYTHTAVENSQNQTVTYTNRHTPVTTEIHVAVAEGENFVLKDDTMRKTGEENYTFTLHMDEANGATGTALTMDTPVDPLLEAFAEEYAFAGIVYGTDGSDGKISVQGIGLERVDYGQHYPTSTTLNNIYERLLNDQTSLVLGENKIYYVYYKMPRIYYMKEGANGALTQIETLTRNGEPINLNGGTVAQAGQLNVSTDAFVISQSATGAYRVPPDLDGNQILSLQYKSLAAGPSGTTNTSAMNAVTTEQQIQLKLVDSQVKYSLDGTTWESFSGEPAIYAIYKEKGHDLNITKELVNGGDQSQLFALTISSAAITETEYVISGYEENGNVIESITATPASATAAGTIQLWVKHGSNITISGLQRGEYIVTETSVENYSLKAAKVNSYAVTVRNQSFSFTITDDSKAELTNEYTSIPVSFRKVDGFGNGAGAAEFRLYHTYNDAFNNNTAEVVSIVVDDVETESVSSASEAYGDVEVGDVSFKVPMGVYYMREIKAPDAHRTHGSFQTSTAIYRVVVGAEGSTVEGIALPQGATSLISLVNANGNVDATGPDIARYGIMNIYQAQRKVILRKTDDSFNTLQGATFDILRYDLSVAESQCKAGTAGALWIGNLPYGTYYLHETNDGNADTDQWFTLTVNESGAGYLQSGVFSNQINPGDIPN